VPERDDLGFLQLITSTSSRDEIVRLLDTALGEMGLSANYLALRVNESDAKLMAKIFAPSDKVTLYADRIKQMAKFKAWFYSEGMRTPLAG